MESKPWKSNRLLGKGNCLLEEKNFLFFNRAPLEIAYIKNGKGWVFKNPWLSSSILPPKNPPGFSRKRRGAYKVMYFEGTPTFRSPEAEENFKELQEARLTLEEPTRLKDLGHKRIEELLKFNGLDKYMEGIEQAEVFKNEVAEFCILNKIKVDWASLVMYNMAMVSKVPRKARHYPRLISKFLNKENLYLYVSEDSKIHPLKFFTAASFKQKLLRRFYKKEMNTIRDEIDEIKLILGTHMDMALLNRDTLMSLKDIHAKRDGFNDDVLRQIDLVNKSYENLEEQIKLNEVKMELAKAKVRNIRVNQGLLLKKLGFATNINQA
ncbi:hypothetical protein ZOSMA_13G00040 [Zostera marina]|uniref:Uncharacterized protein n=1 Tax=Zostera marina TaxID=29655 RepID=A0A0K9PXM4_ZOSMR|nr:hypothetical protein ZOSMA_13G00040 [Zostera marina]